MFQRFQSSLPGKTWQIKAAQTMTVNKQGEERRGEERERGRERKL
jgi:hypothetical protein